ncbi:MAG: TonB-dependent receptor [Proteobacteria bacterium]|nr:TonB-dependent receptor [Pseudomonadota bacterium]
MRIQPDNFGLLGAAGVLLALALPLSAAGQPAPPAHGPHPNHPRAAPTPTPTQEVQPGPQQPEHEPEHAAPAPARGSQPAPEQPEHVAPAEVRLPAVPPGGPASERPISDEPSDQPDRQVEVIHVGSRRVTRSKVGSPTPVDVIDAGEFTNQPSTDMASMLKSLVPSYNVTQQPIRDAATLVRPANLRGLPPDNTVVLVNGKRRHRGAVIVFLGGGIADGSQGVDLASIPAIALKRVEVLRDGAAAQYGADAIAGVMNFVLKDSPEEATLELRAGGYYAGDGNSLTLAGNVGVPLTDAGFANLSIELGSSGATSRSVQRADARALIAAGNPNVAEPAQIWGAPRISNNLKLFANAGLELGASSEAYLFGSFARRSALGGFYFRNPGLSYLDPATKMQTTAGRKGVFVTDAPLLDPRTGAPVLDPSTGMPVTTPVHLVADLNPNDLVPCPRFAPGDPMGLQHVMSDPNCFVFNAQFPGGFTPKFGGTVTDWSAATGVRGQFGRLRWDLSATIGGNGVRFLIKDTVNPSLGPGSPTEFWPGSYREIDQTLNLDLAYPLPIAPLSTELNLAAGLEYRNEQFSVTAGDRASWETGPFFSQGFDVGSNGFQGFNPSQADTFNRRNVAGYLDLELDPLPHWRMALAGRVEHFDSLGSTATVKSSTRYTLFDQVSLRASIGSGFRAPTPGQANVSNIGTVASPTGQLVNRGTIPPTNPIAVAVGGQALQPERSLNFGGGVVLDAGDLWSSDLTLSLDYYNIDVRDRISLSGDKTLTPEQALALQASGITGAAALAGFRFYTNAFDTNTQGLDVVGTFKVDWAGMDVGNTDLVAAYNWNRTKVVGQSIPGIIGEQRINELENALPKHRYVLTANHVYGRFRLLARLSFFGSFKFPENNGDHVFGSKHLVDLEAAVRFLDHFTLVAGVQNIFNTFPDENPGMADIGARYPENAPTGFNGGFWHLRLLGRL